MIKKGLLKRLKSIESKNEIELQAIKNKGKKQLREIHINKILTKILTRVIR